MSYLQKEAEIFLAIMKAFQAEKKRESARLRASIERTGEPPKDCRKSKAFIKNIMHISKKSENEVRHQFNYWLSLDEI